MSEQDETKATTPLSFGAKAPVENVQEEADTAPVIAEAPHVEQQDTSLTVDPMPEAPAEEPVEEQTEQVAGVGEGEPEKSSTQHAEVEALVEAEPEQVQDTSTDEVLSPHGDEPVDPQPVPVPVETEAEADEPSDAVIEEAVASDTPVAVETLDQSQDGEIDATETTSEASEEPEAEAETDVELAPAEDLEQQLEEIDEAPELNIEAQSGEAAEGPSLEELQERKADLARQIEERQNAEKQSVLSQIKTVVESYKITTEDLVNFLGGYKVRRKGVPAKPKYRNPADGTTWSGRGREPAWIKGQNRAKFLIA